jgi:LuxR family maltose regulon positive regulatory protein
MPAASHGAGAAAQALIAEELAEVRPSPMRRRVYLGFCQLLAFRFAAMTGEMARQREPGAGLSGIENDHGWVSRPMRSLVPAQLAIADGRIDEACGLWTEALEDEHRVDLYGQAFESRRRPWRTPRRPTR